jgi:hypothetical protein
MARRTVDESNRQLTLVLEKLLEEDTDITARAVARLHPSLSNASAITRNEERQRLVAQYQERQRELRRWHSRVNKQSRDKTASELAKKDHQISELEAQVAALVDSHVAMIAAVGEVGGMAKLVKFYGHYREIRNRLHELGALPGTEGSPNERRRSETKEVKS